MGKKGENLAVKFLENIGYEIIIQNFRCRQGEIDIIAMNKKEIVFIEVKTRSNAKFGRPIEAVDFWKIQHICKTANYFLHKYSLQSYPVRFDVVEVFYYKNKFYINHIKNIDIGR